MVELFRCRHMRARAKGTIHGYLRFWTEILKDLVTTAFPERLETWKKELNRDPTYSLSNRFSMKRKEPRMDSFAQDFKHALRKLAASPGFTVMALLIVGLGIGANTAMFSIVEKILFRAQPWERAEEIVWVYQDSDEGEPSSSSYPAYRDIAGHTDVFSGVAALIPGRPARHLTSSGDAQQITVSYVTSALFPVLGLHPSRGRWFEPQADEKGGEPVGVVSHHTWQTRFGGEPDVVGRTVRLNGSSVTIVGVGPEGYRGEVPGVDTDFWLSISASGPVGGSYYWNTLERRQDHWFLVLGRLQTGVTADQAQAAMDILADRLGTEYPALNEGRDITVFSAAQVRVHPEQDAFLYPTAGVLMGVVGLVLLIACGNLANLHLARASTRGKEIAVRQAMGATRGRLFRYLLTESIVLAVGGGIVGMLFARWAGRLLATYQSALDIPLTLEVSLDTKVLVFALGLSVLTGLVFGLAPALRASRPDLVPSLKDAGETAFVSRFGDRRFRWLGLRNLLVMIQMAVSLVLLIGAGLLIRSLVNAETVDLGFKKDGLAVLQADAAEAGHQGEASLQLFEELRDKTTALPGVANAALTTRLPVTPRGGSSTLEIEGYEPPTGTGHVEVDFAFVDPDYFDALRIPLLRGRHFTATDRAGTEPVTVVNRAFARSFWGTSDAVGRRYRHQGSADWVRIVGVVGDVKVRTPDETPRPMFFRPLAQGSGFSRLFVVARTSGDPATLVGMMRYELRTIDTEVPVYQAGTMDDHASMALVLPRTAAGLLGLFGALALFLSGLGLYAIVAFAVSQRTAEIGIRIALGATHRRILSTIMKDLVIVIVIGVALGLGLSFLVTPVLESMLFNVRATDPLTFIAVAMFLASVATTAAYLPARRAAHTDPIKALRFE